jgi:hypothetical protein
LNIENSSLYRLLFYYETLTIVKHAVLLICLVTGELYFGDNVYGNTVVRKGLGGAGGGKLEVRSRHVDIDGLVAANGMNPDTRSDRGAGRCTNGIS